jgi:hypothetical protein
MMNDFNRPALFTYGFIAGAFSAALVIEALRYLL